MMKKILFEDVLILNTVKTLRAFVRLLPLRVSFALSRGVGTVIYYLSKRRKIAHKNLRAAFAGEMTGSEMKKIARRSMQNLSMSGVELLRFPEMNQTYIKKNVRILGTQKIDEELKKGKGAIFLTAHFGCWELLNLASNLVGYPMVALARTQKHPRSDEFLNSLRTSKGNQIIRKGMPVREVLKALKNGNIVGMLSDQDGGKKGVFVEFFNRLSSSPSGVATFALRTRAPIFPVFIFREKLGRHRVEVEKPLVRPPDSLTPEEAERDILQQFAKVLESKIRKSPDQWLWAHRRWKSTPNRSILILSDGKQGHLNQSLAVLGSIRREREAQGVQPECTRSKMIEVRFKSHFSKNFLNLVGLFFQGYFPFKSWMLKKVLEKKCYEEIIRTYVDIVVSCGSSIVGVNLLVKAENQAKSAVLMKPSFGSRHFEAVIVPRHDKMKNKPNVFITETVLSQINEQSLKNASGKLLSNLQLTNGHKRIGFLIGGDTQTVKFSRESFTELVEELKRYSLETDSFILATSSRRTPPWADEFLKRSLSGQAQCPLLVIANESNPSGVVPGILGLSDVLVVSGESMSMVSEAVASGKPVMVFLPSKNARLKPKHEEFLKRMVEQRLVETVKPETIYEMIQNQIMRKGSRTSLVIAHDQEVLSHAAKRLIY